VPERVAADKTQNSTHTGPGLTPGNAQPDR
jgi:hypothetical protein